MTRQPTPTKSGATGVAVKLKHVHKVTSKGRVYYYAWRGGPRLEGAPGSPEFMASYHAAYTNRPSRFSKWSIGALVQEFRASPEYLSWSTENKSKNTRYLDLIADEFGHMSLSHFDTPQARRIVLAWRDEMQATPAKADHAVKHLRRLLSWAQERGFIGINVASRVKKLAHADYSAVIWEPAELDALIAAALPALQRAIRLGVLTGLARADLVTLQWNAVSDHSIRTTRQKSGELAIIPLLPATKQLLTEMPHSADTVLTNSRGATWTPSGLSHMFGGAAKQAGVAKRLHDLRGTAATYFLSHQLSYAEVALILGWAEKDVEKIAKRYVHRERFAQSIVDRVSGTNRKQSHPIDDRTVKPL